jgi:hypothetical protein
MLGAPSDVYFTLVAAGSAAVSVSAHGQTPPHTENACLE